MAIYGRFGDTITIVRAAVIGDVKTYENRRPDSRDYERVEQGGYFIVRSEDDGKERLYDLAYMRADDGLTEIVRAIDALYPSVTTAHVEADDIGRKSGEPDYSRDHVE